MKNVFLITLSFISLSTSASILEGNYLCKKGFLGFTVVDSLAIQTTPNGNLSITMNDAQFRLSPNCKVINQPELNSECSLEKDKIKISKEEKGFKNSTLKTTLSFEKLGKSVLVRETELESGHGEALTVLVCRPSE